MIYLLLSILCSAALSIVMRLSEGKVKSKLSMLAINYVVCFLLSWGFGGFKNLFPNVDGLTSTLGMGIFNGLFYMVALVFWQYCIAKNGVILSTVYSKVGGLVVPLLVSVLFFAEVPTIFQFIGFVLAIISVVTMNYQRETGTRKNIQWFLFALFLTDGCAGIMAKVFRENGNAELEFHFLLYTFITAFILCAVWIFIKKERLGKKEVLYGIMIGVPNFCASRFLLPALEKVPAVVVYPAKSIATIGLIALAGFFMFHEKLRKSQWAAMGVIAVALVLLSI